MEGPRGLKSEEKESLIELLDLVFRAGRDGSMGDEYPQMINDNNFERLRVFVDDGKPIAHFGYTRSDISTAGCTFTVGCVGAVSTHPDSRGKGLATKLLWDAFDHFKSEGGDFVFISGGRGLYVRNGAASVGTMFSFTVDKDKLEEFAVPDVKVSEMTGESGINSAARLYDSEPVRFVRLREVWTYFLKSHWCMDKYSRFWFFEGSDGSAYAIANGKDDNGRMSVKEIAGDRRVLLAGLHQLLGEYDCEGFTVPVMDWDTCALDLLRDAGCGEEQSSMPGTIRIVNFPQMVERLRPKIGDASGSEKDGKMVLSVAGKELEFEPAAAAEMIFSGKDVPEPLQGALPISLPWYGLNFI